MEHPTTLEEWKTYIQNLSGQHLRDQAIAVNQVHFIRTLESEGMTPQDICAVLEEFAEQFRRTRQAPPTRIAGGYINYAEILDRS